MCHCVSKLIGIRVGLVRSGASVVRTKQSGVLLKCALGCTLLAHFASEVQSSQAKCTLKIGVRRPSAHLKAPQTDFATCALPKCASRAQNPTFAPCLHTLFSALESYSSFLWCFLLPVIAGLRPHNLFPNQSNFPTPRGNRHGINCTGGCSIAERFICAFCLRPTVLRL
jgi:hypothetical protein